MRDANGKLLDKVSPGFPVEVEGWRELPPAGELVLEVESEKKGREVINYREARKANERLEKESVIIEQKQVEENQIYKRQLEMKRKLGRFKMRREGPRKPEIVEGTFYI